MNVSMTAEIDAGFEEKIELACVVSSELEKFFEGKDYGEGIENIIAHLICMKTIKGIEKFSTVRKPKFTKLSRVKKFDGSVEEYRRLFCFDFKFSDSEYKKYLDSPIDESRALLVKKVRDSMRQMKTNLEKSKPFDITMFFEDLDAWVTDYIDA